LQKLAGKRILVTGGAGFVGSALCEQFLAQDNEVICLDSLITGKWENIEPFQANSHFRFIEGDIRDSGTCLKASEGADFVFHQAALGSVPRSIENPQRTNDINITGTLNVFWAAKENGVKRVVFASSSSVYGDAPKLPKVEDAIGEPLSPYAVTKLVNEKYAKVFYDVYGLETVGLRYFNVFGRRQDPDGAYAAVIPRWVKMLIRKERPVINGDGSYSRDFTYIDNVVQANERAALAENSSEAQGLRSAEGPVSPAGKVYNIAYGGNTTLNELFAILRDNLAELDQGIGEIEPVYGPERPGDIPHSHASIDMARELLGYDPQYDAKAGFRMACDWYWRNLR
jgi:UDP-N-acetylglucosamine 4-epimerase